MPHGCKKTVWWLHDNYQTTELWGYACQQSWYCLKNQNNIFFKNVKHRIFEILFLGVTLYQIVGKYVRFFSPSVGWHRLENPAKQYFSQSVKGDFMYRDHRQGPAKLGRQAAGQEATTLAIISHTLGNFCRPATAVSSLGSSPLPYYT
jgi:hypothetical protein